MKRFSVIKVSFNKYGVWDNKINTRTAWFTRDFTKEQIDNYVVKLNAKYRCA